MERLNMRLLTPEECAQGKYDSYIQPLTSNDVKYIIQCSLDWDEYNNGKAEAVAFAPYQGIFTRNGWKMSEILVRWRWNYGKVIALIERDHGSSYYPSSQDIAISQTFTYGSNAGHDNRFIIHYLDFFMGKIYKVLDEKNDVKSMFEYLSNTYY